MMPVVVMKFGGTSLEDASCIEKALGILGAASVERRVVAVVSAMSGVTDQLIEYARARAAGNLSRANEILERLRERHERAICALLQRPTNRRSVGGKLRSGLLDCERACQKPDSAGGLAPQALDLISSMGERICAPLVAAALAERGAASEAIDATELLVTDCHHGNADPEMELTRERCEARLRPLLAAGIIPVVTGFLGATPDGAVTTLGRGGSDYSATIIGAAIGAEEITLWTDVDGVLTADPRWVRDATSIPEISYRQAATLARFGAKVLHPKTLRPVLRHKIPVWIRNTFAAHRPGTHIVPEEHRNGGGAKALAVIAEAALIGVRSRANGLTPERIKRARAALAWTGAAVLFDSQTSLVGDFCLVVRPTELDEAATALRGTFLADPCIPSELPISLSGGISVLTVVGAAGGESSALARQAAGVIRREDVRVLASALDEENCSFSIALARDDMEKTLVALHRSFHLQAGRSGLTTDSRANAEASSKNGRPRERFLLEECGH